MLAYRCPETHLVVQTSIETNTSELQHLKARMLSLWCPHCSMAHRISAQDAFIEDRQGEFGS